MKNIPSIRVIKESRLDAVIHTKTKREAIMLVKILGVDGERFYDENDFIECWDGHKENTCYRIRNGKVDQMDCIKFYQKINEEIYEFSDLFATGGTISIHDLPTSEWYNPMRLKFVNGSSIEATPNKDVIRGKEPELVWIDKIALPTATETKEMVERVRREILNFTNAFPKEEKKMPTKFTFYTVEGYRMDKSNNTKIPTVTTEVVYKDKDGCATGGSATCDKADYSERDGILNAIANAVLGGNFDREYEKFLADKKRKYDESCKCKICGCNYYEDEKTGKRTSFTPEDARKHEEWHEQNKKNKREKYLIRKEARRRLAEAEREGKIEQTMKELYKK